MDEVLWAVWSLSFMSFKSPAFLLPLSPSSSISYRVFKCQSSYDRPLSVLQGAKQSILQSWWDSGRLHAHGYIEVPLVTVDQDNLHLWVFAVESGLQTLPPIHHSLVGSHSCHISKSRQYSTPNLWPLKKFLAGPATYQTSTHVHLATLLNLIPAIIAVTCEEALQATISSRARTFDDLLSIFETPYEPGSFT